MSDHPDRHSDPDGSLGHTTRPAPLTIRKAEFTQRESSAVMTVDLSDGTSVYMNVVPDSIGNYYAGTYVRRPGTRTFEKIVQCLNDSVHSLVARGLRGSA